MPATPVSTSHLVNMPINEADAVSKTSAETQAMAGPLSTQDILVNGVLSLKNPAYSAQTLTAGNHVLTLGGTADFKMLPQILDQMKKDKKTIPVAETPKEETNLPGQEEPPAEQLSLF